MPPPTSNCNPLPKKNQENLKLKLLLLVAHPSSIESLSFAFLKKKVDFNSDVLLKLGWIMNNPQVGQLCAPVWKTSAGYAKLNLVDPWGVAAKLGATSSPLVVDTTKQKINQKCENALRKFWCLGHQVTLHHINGRFSFATRESLGQKPISQSPMTETRQCENPFPLQEIACLPYPSRMDL